MSKNTCLHCDCDIANTRFARGKPVWWRCEGCHREGDYAQGLRLDGTVFEARIERVPPDPERCKRLGVRPWVLAGTKRREGRAA